MSISGKHEICIDSIYPATPGLRFDTGTNMIPWRFLKRFSCFAVYQRHAEAGPRTERAAYTTRIFRKAVWQIDRIERGPIDWHIILMAVRVIAGARSESMRKPALIYLDPRAPRAPAQLSLHADANARRYTKSNAYIRQAIRRSPWIKFRVAVNLDHLLRRGKHNFKLSFANKHEPWRAERFLLAFPNKFFLPCELSTDDDGFEKSYLCVTFCKLRPLSVSFVSRSHAIFCEFFARADATRRAIIERWKLHRNSPIGE